MHDRDRRRTPPVAKRIVQKPVEPDFRDGKGYKFMVSKKLSRILGTLCVLIGLFAVVDYWGPKTTSHEKIFCFPNGGNYFLIRTNLSHFPTDPRLQYKTTEMHDALIDVNKSLTGVPISFSMPELYGSEVFYPVSTRYSYLYLQIICLIAGLVLLLYPKYDDIRMYMVFFGVLFLFCGIIPMIGLELTIDAINNEPTMNCGE